MRKYVLAATAVGGAALVVRRPSDGRPSIADALRLTGNFPALVRADRAALPPSTSVLESAVLDARSGARVALCGVCHCAGEVAYLRLFTLEVQARVRDE